MPTRSIRSSTQWRDYFQANAAAQLHLPWKEALVSTEELRPIAASLQAWQLGETSDGAHLREAARRHAEAQNDPLFVDCVELFIAEEQRHGELLGSFLDRVAVPRLARDWGDSAFRAVRYLARNMEIWATIVVMVETLAMLFYRAIWRATRSPLLRRICAQLLRDEVAHLAFQQERLAVLHRGRREWLRQATLLLHRALFLAVTLAVWLGHGRALRAGGYGFAAYLKEAWRRMNDGWRRMNPALYERTSLLPQSHAAPARIEFSRTMTPLSIWEGAERLSHEMNSSPPAGESRDRRLPGVRRRKEPGRPASGQPRHGPADDWVRPAHH